MPTGNSKVTFSADRPPSAHAPGVYDALALDAGRENSYVRRTVTRTVNLLRTTASSRSDVTDPDFLNLITAAEELYAQRDVMEMQQLDGHTRTQVGKGGVFDVSTVNAESTLPSETAANTTVRYKREVIVKRPPTRLFDSNGTARPDTHGAAAKFVMELRVLSNPYIRRCSSIIRLLGIGWEYTRSNLTAPEPNLILERAQSTLYEFQKEYPALPFETKRLICLDIANGLSALHECGVIHGDVKTDNILMIESTRWVAKVADFSHSMLATDRDEFLVGGTQPFNAPEWRKKLSSADLYKTDVFSFGLVLGCVIVGRDVFDEFCKSKRNGRNFEEFRENFEVLKQNDRLQEYIIDLLYEIDDTDLASRREDIASTKNLLEFSLQAEPAKRNLQNIIQKLTKKDEIVPPSLSPETVISRLDANTIAVPYQALNTSSQVLKSHIVASLEAIASKPDDEDDRAPTACYELCVCYFSGFGTAVDYGKAAHWLMEACERKQPWARSTVHRLLDGMQAPCSSTKVEEWLHSAVKEGSLMALESLQERNSQRYSAAIRAYRDFTTRSAGPTELDWNWVKAVLDGISKRQESAMAFITKLEDSQNANGDTLLLCACRAGQHEIAHNLLDIGANARTCNNLGENALHLLACFDSQEIPALAERLFDAQADWTSEATGSSIVCAFEQRPVVAGCPLVRAVIMNRPLILKVLFQLESRHEKNNSVRQKRMKDANLRKMLALACRQCNVDVLEVVRSERSYIWDQDIDSMGFWIDERRYSLSALAIAGCVSDRASSGFNVPENFWRCNSHGRRFRESLQGTLSLLRAAKIDFNTTPCGGDPNALFFAVRNGRADAVDILLANYSAEDIFEAFGSKNATFIRDSNIFRTEEPSQIPNHSPKSTMVDAIYLSVQQGHRDIFRTLLRTRNHEALKMGIIYPVVFRDIKPLKTISFDNPWNLISLYFQEPEDIRRYFPELRSKVYRYKEAWKIPLLPGKIHNHYYVSDGRLNYSLLYMVYIASSLHRDIQLAHILLEELRAIGVHDHHKWVPRDYFEACCLGLGVPVRSPLGIAATALWPDLVTLLIDNGADPRARIYVKTGRAENARSGFDDISMFAQVTGGDKIDYMLRPVLSNLLCAEDGDSKRLQGARSLLVKNKDNRHKIQPKTVEELNVFLVTSATIQGKLDFNVDEEIAELWSILTAEYKAILPFPKDRTMGLLHLGASLNNASALKCFLDLGLSPNGKLWHRLTMTPYDVVRCRATKEVNKERMQCLRLLEKHGARRGPFYLLEFQFLCTIVGAVLAALLIYATYYLLNKFYGLSRKGVDYFASALLLDSHGLPFHGSWILLTTGFYIYGTVLVICFMIIGSPGIMVIAGLIGIYYNGLSLTTVALHTSPVAWLLSTLVYEEDWEAVKLYVYGPTVTFIKSMSKGRVQASQIHSPPHRSAELPEETSLHAQLPTTAANSAGLEITENAEEGPMRRDIRQYGHHEPNQQTNSHHVRWAVDKLIIQPISTLTSAGDKIAALSRGIRSRRRGQYLRIPRSDFVENDDDESLRSLLGEADYEESPFD